MTKLAHFLPIKTSFSSKKHAKLYIRELVRLHGMPLSIISDHDMQFTSHFLKSFQRNLGTKVKLSTIFHSKTDRPAERTIQNIEDTLRACVSEFNKNWDYRLSFIEYSYKNSYHSSIEIELLKPLYEKRYRSLVGWFQVGDIEYINPYSLLDTIEKVKIIRERLSVVTSYIHILERGILTLLWMIGSIWVSHIKGVM